MPKHGPREGSLMAIPTFLPKRFKDWPSPITVVVLPSPDGVGLVAVTSISLPFSFPDRSREESEIFAISLP
jgi:hypothetical protein